MGAKIAVVPGTQHHRWTILAEIVERGRWGRVMVRCRCQCGSEGVRSHHDLIHAETKSCGCLNREMCRKQGKNRKHGDAKSLDRAPEYRIWSSMKSRCTNPRICNYAQYGGRGISVDQRWMGSYEEFLADVGRRPSSKHSLDRIDVNGNYEPGNVRWATDAEQKSNMRTNRLITTRGKTQTVAQWARESGTGGDTIRWRLKKGLSTEDAIFSPLTPGKSHPRAERKADQTLRDIFA